MIMEATDSSARKMTPTTRTEEAEKTTNVGTKERMASAGGGAWLVSRGLRRGGLSGAAMAGFGGMLLGRGLSGHCPIYEKLDIDTNGQNPPAPTEFYERGIHVSKAYTITKPASELFSFWRNFENLPKFMTHLEEVTVLDDKRSHWKARAPAGATVEWDAEIIHEEPDQVISWRSLKDADVHSSGSVRFTEIPEVGTEVRVILNYLPPLGKLGALVARLFGEEPAQQIQEDLRHFKQLMETGEIPTNEGPRGDCSERFSQERFSQGGAR